MRYISTRGQAPVLDFAGVLLAGLAEDGGLYVPESWPRFGFADWRALRGLPYPALAARIMQPFVGDAMPADTLAALCRDAYAGFGQPAVVPLLQLETGLFVQELFHGPTLAFKDMALQVVGRLFDHVLAERGERVTIVGATSGDTGSAAIEACLGRERIYVVFLHPHDRISEVQRRQMTTVHAPNVGNIAVDRHVRRLPGPGEGDVRRRAVPHRDAPVGDELDQLGAHRRAGAVLRRRRPGARRAGSRGGVQRADRQFRQRARRLGGAAHGAAGGAADRRFQPQRYPGPVPGGERHVDGAGGAIAVAQHGHPGQLELRARCCSSCWIATPAATAGAMQAFRRTGRMAVPDMAWRRARTVFHGFRLDDAGTEAEIRRLHETTGYLADPHTAVGIAAARALPPAPAVTTVAVATAHPAKFPDAIERAVGWRPPLPPRLADLYDRAERFLVLPNELGAVEAAVRALTRRNMP